MPPLVLETERLRLAMLPPEDALRVLAYFEANRAHLEPYDPPKPRGFFTGAHWHARLAQSQAEYEAGISCRLFLCARDDDAVIGTANLSQIFRGPFLSCMLGYALDHRHVGRGLMTEALRALIAHAFGPLGLHRIQANYMPTNVRSGATLRRLGFVVEGYARDYLCIDGQWRDHVLTALINPDLPPPGPP